MTESPTPIQLDALREVANIGVGHAATALSRLVGGKQVHIDVPRAHVADGASLAGLLSFPPEPLLLASFEVLGELQGRLLFVMPQPDAVHLARLLARQLASGGGELTLQQSALAEAANIVASACLSAIGDLTQMTLLPSVPAVVERTDRAVLSEAVREVEEGAGLGVVLEARFEANTDHPFSGQLLVVPAFASVKRLLSRLGV